MSITKDIMTLKPISIKATDSLTTAYKIMHAKSIRHLPVVDERNSVVGILSDRDIQRAMQVKKLNNLQQEIHLDASLVVEDFMSWPVYVVSETTTVKHVAEEMLSQKVSAFLVEDTMGRMKGIITTDDILQLFIAERDKQTGVGIKAISHYFVDAEI
jgi:CBS domain-containing protein